MTISELEVTLLRAQERLRTALGKLPRKREQGEVSDFEAATEAVHQAERALAAAKGEQYAMPIEFPARWDTGAPCPHLLQNDIQTFLFFFLPDRDADSNEKILEALTSDGMSLEKIALVEFEHCSCAKMGAPNDEVLHGHPLYGKGLFFYGAFLVENSIWIKELEAINSVHTRYTPEAWKDLKHFILCFHDCTFECVARGFTVEKWRATVPSMLAEVCKRLSV